MRIKNQKLLSQVRAEPCVLCGKKSDACHVKSKGSGGDDIETNLLSMCREHHRLQHYKGWKNFIDLHPRVEEILSEKGWRLEMLFGRTRLVRK